MNIVILAAGQGKRMHSDLPKVLHPLAGRALLSHVLATAHALTPESICVVYGHGGEAVRQHFEKMSPPDVAVSWARQAPQFGTGHAVMQALPHLKAAAQTLILYGDVPLTRVESLQRLVAVAGAGLGILTVELEDPAGYGRIVRDPAGRLVRIVEQKDATPAERAITEINTGIMVLPTVRLKAWLTALKNNNAQKEYYLTDVIAAAVKSRVAVGTAGSDIDWETTGVNSKAQLAELERIYQFEVADMLMEKGVTLSDPSRIDVRGRLTFGRDVAIDINCVFEGDVTLGDGVTIGPQCVLKNVRVAAGTRIEAFCHFEDAVIGANCRLGPYARIRPGSKLAEGVHIGNFTEVKNSDIGAGSKANHLSYIGDSTVGRNVNVGAGTITCNYDGVNKHRTVIEADVHVGSNSVLVAPVTIGAGGTIGGGSTITKDTPPGALTVARGKQTSIAPWPRPQKK